MDYDKIYFPSYIEHSINKLKETKSGLVGALNMLFIYPKLNYSVSYFKSYSKRQIYEESMCFTKKHFTSMGGFANLNIGEGSKLIDFSNHISTTDSTETITFINYDKYSKNKYEDYLLEHQVFAKINMDYINIINNILNVSYNENIKRNFKEEALTKEKELQDKLEKEKELQDKLEKDKDKNDNIE